MVSADVLREKAESIRRCIDRIESHTPPTVEGLVGDVDAQDIVVLNLQRAVQVAGDMAAVRLAENNVPVSSSLADAFRALAGAGIIDARLGERMAKAVGFRNIAVHEYTRLDWTVVHAIAQQHLNDFREFIRQTLPHDLP